MTLFAAILGIVAMLGGTASAARTKGHRSSRPSIRILHRDQSSISRRGVVVKVRSRKAGRVKLSGLSTTFDDGRRRLTKRKAVHFRRPGTRTVRLPLLRKAKQAVSGCTARTIVVRAGKAKRKVQMTRTLKACRLPSIPMKNAKACDFIAEPGNALCMLPFPNDYYTVADPASETGRRVNLQAEGMPANVVGERIEPEIYNVSNGFSQGSSILVRIPGIESVADVAAMGGTPIDHIGRYAEKNAPVVVIDAKTGKRWPIWTEIDSAAVDPAKRVLEIHPAVNFDSAGHYVVALRNVRNAAGKKVEAPAAFRYYRDEMPSRQREINARRKGFNGIFQTLKKAGIRRDSLYLAWDFTVASDENNAHRLLSIRNDAFAKLGDGNLADGVVRGVAPTFKVTEPVEVDPFPEIARRVKGTVTVPCYLFPSCANGGTFRLGPGDVPMQNGTFDANFDCIVPKSVTEGPAGAARVSLLGHGLFSSAKDVALEPQRTLAQTHKIVFCATNEIGMAEEDVGPLVSVLSNLSRFPRVADRLQQGLLDELYLGRAMISTAAAGGFSASKAFSQDGTAGTGSVLDTSRLYYNGNSEGGIEGGALTAVSPDFTRATLGVPAINFSVLLPRSIDFDRFARVLYPAYPNEIERPLALDLIQMLWDRAEPNGYAHRMTSNPLPNTPAHQVLMNVAFGDHQVTQYQADVEARTIGASAHLPGLYAGRWPDVDYMWNLPAIASYPYTGSAIYYWDTGPVRPDPAKPGGVIGVDPPPLENLPNRSGQDPHLIPRLAAAEQQLVSDFFNGAIQQTDACGGGPCYAGTFTGP